MWGVVMHSIAAEGDRCWADEQPDETGHRSACLRTATSPLGLCEEHDRELVGKP